MIHIQKLYMVLDLNLLILLFKIVILYNFAYTEQIQVTKGRWLQYKRDHGQHLKKTTTIPMLQKLGHCSQQLENGHLVLLKIINLCTVIWFVPKWPFKDPLNDPLKDFCNFHGIPHFIKTYQNGNYLMGCVWYRIESIIYSGTHCSKFDPKRFTLSRMQRFKNQTSNHCYLFVIYVNPSKWNL